MSDLAASTEKTRALANKFVEYVTTTQFEEAYRLLNQDGQFILTGQTPASGVYKGLDDIFARLAPALSGYTERPTIRVSDVLVDGTQAFVRASGEGKATYGEYKQPYYGYYLRRDGEGLSEIIEFFDPLQIEIAFFNKKLVDA
ncbi:hypothetical protein PV10_06432 [Exophiala mesophila]|uniref:SnoaL-like domain-containing protein n=1 Tax=Exophiala mesophila TaxID=212818 RepID=A0A0D1WRZ5_EXOME|nr:uncharacterized protein PV10_06432 [Exophiala mesophila]KIV91945.1 hypothetical protein PV10_06432 [Exophiala mesophila]